MTVQHRLRTDYLVAVCKALSTYIERNHGVRLKTIGDDESATELAHELHGKAAIVFTIEDWEAFRELLEPGRPD